MIDSVHGTDRDHTSPPRDSSPNLNDRGGRPKTADRIKTPLFRFLVMPISYVVLRATVLFAQLMPPAVVYAIARAIAGVSWYLFPRRRLTVTRNLEIAFRDTLSPRQRRTLGRRSLQHFLLSVVDLMILPRHWVGDRWKRVVTITPEQDRKLRDLALHDGPCVIHCAHLGSWETTAAVVSRYGRPLTSVYRPLEFPRIDAETKRLRSSFGCTLIPKQGALRAYISVLKGGEWLGVIADQNAGSGAAFLDFFGVPAATEVGHLTLYRRFGARATALFVVRDGMRFRFKIKGIYETELDPSLDREDEAMRLGRWYLSCIEDALTDCPDQYNWAHRRYRSRPPGAPGLYGDLDKPLAASLLEAQPRAPIKPARWTNAGK